MGAGRFGRRAPSAVRAAPAGSAGVGYGNRHRARCSDGRERGGKLLPGHVGGGLVCTVPIHDHASTKATAVDRQGERWVT
jgi:hypothetical protein